MQDNPNQWPHRIGILGVGLLGGSAALALRRRCPQTEFAGLTRSETTAKRLVEAGIVDRASQSVEEVCRDCDAVIVAAPVDRIASLVVRAAEITGPDCLITDVGSTKAKIVNAIADHPQAETKFVGAHPIAGSEKTGAEHATADLMDDKLIILTPSPRTPPEQLQRAVNFWELTGGMIKQMSAQEHDTHLASVSHVPHLVSALVAKLPAHDARPLVGSGWQDITRVAAGDPEMWTAICQENREAIIDELERFSTELDQLRQLIGRPDSDQLKAWLAEAKQLKHQSM